MLENSKQPVINFMGYRITNLEYVKVDNKIKHNNKTKLDIKSGLDFDKKIGTVVLNSIFTNEEQGIDTSLNRRCNLEITGFFGIRNDLSKEEAKKFISVNGAAMLYPYLRTISSTIVSLDDSKNVILPSLNFTDQYNDSDRIKD